MIQVRTVIFAAAVTLAAASLRAQAAKPDKSQRPSPPATPASCTFSDGKTVVIDYSQPSMRGRKIYGGLVPYGQVWRTGANEATGLVTGADLQVGDAAVPRGSYTLYTVPAEGTWKLVINKQTGQWGTIYDQQQDLARIDMKKEALAAPVEKFLISFQQNGGDQCTLRLDWENTRASVAVKEKR